MINDVVYHFHGHGTPDARCVVSFLELDSSNGEKDEAHVQLFHKEFQKRGIAHVHISNFKIRAQRILTLSDVEDLINEKWE